MDSKEKYNQIIFLETIKTGKMPKRSGLGYRLYLLAGFTRPIMATCKKNIKIKKYNFDQLNYVSIEGLTNRIEFYTGVVYDVVLHNQNSISKDLMSPQMETVFRKYLGLHRIVKNGPNTYVYYKPNVVINWGELDDHLQKMHPTKCRIDKRGFVYYKQR